MSEDWGPAPRLQGAIAAYQVASGKTLAESILHAGKELSYQLYLQTGKATPSADTIRAGAALTGFDDPARKHRRKEDRKQRTGLIRSRIVQHGGMEGMIAYRVAHRKFAASGWLVAWRAFKAGTKYRVSSIFGRLGYLTAFTSESGEANLTLGNRTGGIFVIAQKHPEVLSKAVAGVVLDMSSYIKRRLGEEAQKAFLKIGVKPNG